MATFIFTRAVREDAVKLIKGIGKYGGLGSNALAAIFGADMLTTVVGGFVLYVATHVLALYLQGLQTKKDVEVE
jgi:hypothetical protein